MLFQLPYSCFIFFYVLACFFKQRFVFLLRAAHLSFQKLTLFSHGSLFLLAYVFACSALFSQSLGCFHALLSRFHSHLGFILQGSKIVFCLNKTISILQFLNPMINLSYFIFVSLEIAIGLKVVENSRNEETLNVER